jgi:uncharacterized membrane protein
LLLSEAVQLLILIATPIVDLFPEGTFGEIRYPTLLALLVLFVLSLLIGLAMRLAILRAIGRGVERTVLDRLPLYRALANLLQGFGQSEDGRAFKAAVLNNPGGVREFVYVVEDLGGACVTLLRPHAPAGFNGPVGIVPRDQIEPLDTTIGEVSKVLGQWGVGAQSLIGSDAEDA